MATDTTFPEGDAQAELDLNLNKKFDVDPVSSEIASDKAERVEKKEIAKANARAQRDAAHSLKKTIIISAVIVAVAGAAFAITKKMKEK